MSLQLTPHQQQAFTQIKTFVRNLEAKVFVLKGYAGTGKTTLVKFLLDWLGSVPDYEPVLLASTGRAAKILQSKAGHDAFTVHSHIYSFSVIEEKSSDNKNAWESKTGQLMLNFELKTPPKKDKKLLYVVDEASMLSHLEKQGGHIAKFGSGNLLLDLFHFVGKNKLIFVGDPVQLPPPVGKNPFSSALDVQFIQTHFNKKATGFELTEILRQKEGHSILNLASQLRACVVNKQYSNWEELMNQKGQYIFHPYTQNVMIKRYLETIEKGLDKGIILTHSNKQAYFLNMTMRELLQGSKQLFNLKIGELLLVVQNSYDVPLANGDQVVVRNTRFVEKRAGFTFLEVKVESVHDKKIHNTYLIKEFLFAPEANLDPEKQKRLLIDFDKRARNRGLKRNSEEYKDAMRNDKFLNALRAKFGYAVTCHKSQGGEWPKVFINLSETLNMLDMETKFRWLYTAVTRAQLALDIKPIYRRPKNYRRR